MVKSWRPAFAALALAVLSACATAHPFVRPTGPAVPLADAASVWQAATTQCRNVRAYRGELRLSGKVAGERVQSVTLGLAVDATGQLGFEPQGFGSRVFRFGGNADRATLLLRADNRVVTAPAADIVEALIGVRLDPSRLLAVLSGCVATSGEATTAERIGAVARVTTADAVVFLSGEPMGFRPRAGLFEHLLVDYQRLEAGYPRQIAITSDPGRQPAVDLSIAVRSLEINPAFTGAEFRVVPSPQAVPASLDELRAAGPLGKAP